MTAFTGFCIGIIVCITASVLGEREYGRMMYRRGYRKAVEAIQGKNEECNRIRHKWIPCNERIPTREEYLENDGRFVLDDGNRRYFGLFDIYEGKFKTFIGDKEDKCVIAWMPLPEPYKGEVMGVRRDD